MNARTLPRHPDSARLRLAGISLIVLAASLIALSFATPTRAASEPRRDEPARTAAPVKLTLIHMGDIHGHLVPRPSLRGNGEEEGGLARMYSQIRQIRKQEKNVLLFNTGDTIQGSAEALYTRGQGVVDVLDRFGIDGYALGNWDCLYGKARLLELFGPGTGDGPAGTRFGTVAANLYHEDSGKLMFPPYFVKHVNGLKIGVLGLASERAINAIGSFITAGIRFTSDAAEVPGYVEQLRKREKVDLIVLLSEFGLAKNILIANANPDIDLVLSSDMHEETRREVIADSGALISEVGQDGTRIAQIDLTVKPDRAGKKIVKWKYTWHRIDSGLKADPEIAARVKKVRAPFIAGSKLARHVNPLNGSVLDTPIDRVVGETAIPLYRGNFSGEPMPGVIEGSSSDFLADVFRAQTGADIGHFRGFRFGTHVPRGPITLEDIYHFVAVGPQIASTTITGQQLKDNIEASADGSFNPDPFLWTGGWLHAYGGVRMDLDAYRPKGQRASNIRVQRASTGKWERLRLTAHYTFAGFWYEPVPNVVGGITTTTPVNVLRGAGKKALDGTRVVSDYLKYQIADPELNRVRLLFALPPPIYGNPEIQPLLGVPVFP